MKNHEIVMEELRQLPNLDENLYTEEGIYNKEEIWVGAKSKKLGIAHGTLTELVHSIRALKEASLEGTIENIEKGLRVFSMLESIYAYNRCATAESMASDRYFTEPMYNIGVENVRVMAQYLIDKTSKIDVDVYTDCEGCSYNSLELAEVK